MQAINLLIFGAPGSGVSTLCEKLSSKLQFSSIILQNRSEPPDSGDPILIGPQELIQMKQQLQETKGYIIDGSPCLMDWSLDELDGIIYLRTPKIQRLQRLRTRELASQGQGILKEGCREFKKFNRFMYWVSQFDQAGVDRESKILHQKFLNSLRLPLLEANGLLNQEDLIQQVLEWINELESH